MPDDYLDREKVLKLGDMCFFFEALALLYRVCICDFIIPNVLIFITIFHGFLNNLRSPTKISPLSHRCFTMFRLYLNGIRLIVDF